MRPIPGTLHWALLVLLLGGCGSDQTVNGDEAVADAFRLDPDIAPVAQQIFLQIDPEKTEYSGNTTITIEVRKSVAEIRLHAKEMRLESLSLSRDGEGLDVTHAPGEHGLLVIGAADAFPAGTYELRIEFANEFNSDGASINRTEQEGRHYVFSQFQAIHAREAFPCFDEPGFKFPWQLTMEVPADLMPITNTPVISTTEHNGRKTVVFDTTPPLPSYLIAIAVGAFDAVPIEGMSVPGRVIVPQGKAHLAAAAVETTPPLLAYLEDYFGQPYPFKKLDLIASNQAFSGAMEHPGAITYSDFFLLLDDTAGKEQKTLLIKITAHELAHQWFGNLVTMQWWNDLWLNESFADWLGDKAAEAVYPQYSRALEELRTMLRVMDFDARPLTKQIRHDFKSTDDFADGIFLSYYKGKAVLGMFEEAVGPDIFRDGVVRYIRAHSRGNAQASDLWTEINAGVEFDLAAGLASFIDQPGIPLITVENLGEGRFRFTQNRHFASADRIESDEQWVIPVTYKYRSSDTVATGKLLIDEPAEIVELDPDTVWVLPNADQKAYFRWTVPAEMMVAISAAASDSLSVRERMGLISNVWALLTADRLDGKDYYETVRGLAGDRDPDVLRAILSQLIDSTRVFITRDSRPAFGAYLRAIFRPVVERIGMQPVAGESADVAALRSRILVWLADYGKDPEAIAVMDRTTRMFLDGDIPASAFVGRALRSTASRGDLDLFDEFRAGLEAATTPGERRLFVLAVSEFQQPEAVQAVLDYVREGPLRPNDISDIIAGLARWPDNNQRVLSWAMRNDAYLRDRLPADSMRNVPGILMLCSAANVDEIVEFYGAPERFVEGIGKELEEEAAEQYECAAFRQREQDSVRHYLNGFL